VFASASFVANNRVVFNLCGNKYRLVVNNHVPIFEFFNWRLFGHCFIAIKPVSKTRVQTPAATCNAWFILFIAENLHFFT